MTRLAVALLAFVVLAAPLAAEAQSAVRVYRVGWLHPLPIPPDWEDGFRQGLREFGYLTRSTARRRVRSPPSPIDGGGRCPRPRRAVG